MSMVLSLSLVVLMLVMSVLAEVDPYQPLPSMAKLGEPDFDAEVAAKGNTTHGMTASTQNNPLQFPVLEDLWCAWELTDRKRKPALLVDDMQFEYASYVYGIMPQVKLLISSFRAAGLPIFWSTWWRWGPDDGFFNTMDRFYGPIGSKTALNALYNSDLKRGGDVLTDVAPVTDEEKRRVMHKSYSLDMFDERPMEWLVPSGQGTLHAELQTLGVDTVVQVGAWTDDCIISTAFHAFSLQYDIVLVEDAVSTASKQQFNAIEVMRGSVAKVLSASAVADYVSSGLPVTTAAAASSRGKRVGARAAPLRSAELQQLSAHTDLTGGPSAVGFSEPRTERHEEVARLLNTLILVFLGPACFFAGWLARGHAGPARSFDAPFLTNM